jgi:hypothetical protein
MAAAPTTTAQSIATAVAYLRSRTKLPIDAPSEVPGVPAGAVLSATATTDSVSYQVDLWRCSPARPLNDPGVGNLDCGGEAQRFGSFGAQQESSATAAQAALPGLANAQPARCQATNVPATSTFLGLGSGARATAWSCPGIADPVEVRWSANGWDYVLFFGTEDFPLWGQTLDTLVSHLRANPLPAARGVFAVTYAGDGAHSQAAWAIGTTVYTAFNDHSDTDAADLVAAMRPRP